MVDIFNAKEYEKILYSAASAALSFFDIDEKDADLEIGLISKEEMQSLNKESREIDEVTDVLSFPNLNIILPFNKSEYKQDINPETGGVILGEVYICIERAQEQAIQYQHSLERELSFLAVHGILHLMSFDHMDKESAEKMESIQEKILSSIGVLRNNSNIINSSEDLDDSSSPIDDKSFKCGHVAVLGRPNSGKSTLINYFVGHKVSIVSWKPQTTRNRILGIRNDEDSQIIFVDTPGLHKPENELGRFMMRSVTAALNDVDALIYIINSEKEFSNSDKEHLQKYLEAEKKVIVAVNKIDRVDPKRVARILTTLSTLKNLSAVVPISALRGKNALPLLQEIKKVIPNGPPIYPDDIYTDRSMRFLVTEIIREKALKLLEEEIPYGVAVTINNYEEKEDDMVVIDANLVVQKSGHKGIVLGKDGTMIKKISTYARQDIENITQTKVFLTLWVRVEKDWRDDEKALNKFGYNKADYKPE